MFCSKCGAKLPDEARFCNICGAAVNANANPAPTPVPEYSPFTYNPEPASPEAVGFDGSAYEAPAESIIQKPKRKPLGIILTAIILVIAIVGGSIGGVFLYNRMNTPVSKILKAIEKAIDEGSFTLEIKETEKYNDDVDTDKRTYYIIFDEEESDFIIPKIQQAYSYDDSYAYTDYETETKYEDSYKYIGYSNHDYSFYQSKRTSELEKNNYESTSIHRLSNEKSEEEKELEETVKKLINAFLDKDYDVAAEILNELFNKEIDEKIERLRDVDEGEEIDEEQIKELNECKDMLEPEGFKKAVKGIMKNLGDKEWLEENLGYSKKNKKGITTISFDANAKDLIDILEDWIDEYEDAFNSETVYDALSDALNQSQKHLAEIDDSYGFSLDLSFDGSKIVAIEYTYNETWYSEDEYTGDKIKKTSSESYELTISDYGETEIPGEIMSKFRVAKEKLGDYKYYSYKNDGSYYYETKEGVYYSYSSDGSCRVSYPDSNPDDDEDDSYYLRYDENGDLYYDSREY